MHNDRFMLSAVVGTRQVAAESGLPKDIIWAQTLTKLRLPSIICRQGGQWRSGRESGFFVLADTDRNVLQLKPAVRVTALLNENCRRAG